MRNLVFFVVIFAVAIGAYFVFHPTSPHRDISEIAPATPTAGRIDHASVESSAPRASAEQLTAAPRLTQPTRDPKTLNAAEIANATDLTIGNRLRALSDRLEFDDGAKRASIVLSQMCHSAQHAAHAADLLDSNSYMSGRRMAVETIERQCNDAYGGAEMDRALTDSSERGGASSYLEPDYPQFEAAVRTHGKIADVLRLGATLAANHLDGEVVDVIGATLTNYDYPISFPGISFYSTLGHSPAGQTELLMLALALLQCDEGALCGPNSTRVLQFCLTRAVCDPSMSLDAQVNGLLLSRIEFDDLQRIRALLHTYVGR